MNPGTEGGGSVTTVGDHCAFLANSHVGHDCRVGNNVIFSNNVMLAGHCTVGDYAIIGGGAAVIQFARVGSHAFVGGMSGLENDLIPYGMALGNRAYLSGLNIVGLQRRGFSRADIHGLRRAYRLLFAAEGTLMERVEDVAQEFAGQPIVDEIIAFIRAGGKRSLCTPSCQFRRVRRAMNGPGNVARVNVRQLKPTNHCASALLPVAVVCRLKSPAVSKAAAGSYTPL